MKVREIGLMARIALTGVLTCGVTGAGLGAVLLGARPAYAAEGIRYVGAVAGNDTSCASPGYTSVQAAVNAARPGDTVYLCGTTPFREQVVVTKSVTLTGRPGATIAAPSPWAPSADPLPPQFAADDLAAPQAIVVVWGRGVHVTIRGLAIAGPLPGGGCAEEEYGILVIDGASVLVAHDAVTDIRDADPSLYGCQTGVGIEVGREHWPTAGFTAFRTEDFTGRATITGTAVTGYQKAGIVIDAPGSSAWVSGNEVTGAGPDSALGRIIAQNGIQVSRGAFARVARNTVSGNQYSGPAGASSGGVLIYGGCGDPLTTHVVVAGNRLTGNDVGVYLYNADAGCVNAPGSRTGDLVLGNRISDPAVTNTSGYSTSPLCGYQAGVADLGNHDAIIGNDIRGAGYQGHPSCTTAQPYVTFAIDTTGSIDPLVVGNH